MTRVQRAQKESLSHNTLIFRGYKCEKGKQEEEEEEEGGGGPHQEATYGGRRKSPLAKNRG